jgi:hypothetical protein
MSKEKVSIVFGECGSLNLGIPSSRYLWAAKAKVRQAIVTINQRKRLTRWGQTA